MPFKPLATAPVFFLLCLFAHAGSKPRPASADHTITAPPRADLDEALSAFERACQAVWSFDVHLHLRTMVHVESSRTGDRRNNLRLLTADEIAKATVHRISHQRWFGQKSRVDMLQLRDRTLHDGDMVALWDGATETTYNANHAEAHLSPRSLPSVGTYRILYGDLFRGSAQYSYIDLIRQRSKSAIKVTRSNGLVTVSVAAEPTRRIGRSNLAYDFVLDPTQGWMPRRIDVAVDSGNGPRKFFSIENELSDQLGGVWIPIRSRHTLYDSSPKSTVFGQVVGVDEINVDLEHSLVNVPIAPDVFQLDLPLGTTIVDRMNHTEYRKGADKPEPLLNFLAQRGRLSVDSLKSVNSRPVTVRWWLLTVNVLLLLALVAFLVLRKRLPPVS
jgi:hypothetical protein